MDSVALVMNKLLGDCLGSALEHVILRRNAITWYDHKKSNTHLFRGYTRVCTVFEFA